MMSEKLSLRDWGLLFVLCGALFLEGLDVSMIAVALPSIRSDLGMSTGELQWVVSAYVLGYGGLLLLGGRAADLLGRRRMFLLWLGVFLGFSGLGGLATEGWMLILARFVTGMAAAFLTPAGLSIITTSFAEGSVRNKALLVYAATAAGGFSLGLVVGGLLTEVSWRLVFFVPVAISSLVLLAAVRLVPSSGTPARSLQGFDIAGAMSLTAAMLLLVLTVVEAPEAGWGSVRTIAGIVTSAAILTGFVLIERRSTAPLVRLGIFRSGSLLRSNIGAMSLAGAFFGFQFIAVMYLQQLRGWSSFETGLAMLPLGIDTVLAWTLTPRLVSRFGLAPVIAVGLSSAVVAFMLFLPIGASSDYATAIFPTMVLTGIAFALAYGPLTIAATNGVAPEEQGLASGLLNTSFQFGAALGLAVVTAVITANTGESEAPQALLDGFRAALIVPLIILFVGIGATVTGLLQASPSRTVSEPSGPSSSSRS